MKQLIFILLFFITPLSFCQNSLSDLLSKHNTKNIAYMSVQELAMPKTKALILDAREVNEFNTSHLKNAIYVGYNDFNIKTIKDLFPNKTSQIVVYCSIGIRSETIANKLKKEGYTNIYNLYGGIFEWKNHGYPVYNSEEKQTEEVHTFSKEWRKWLTKGKSVY
ncbi:rhodanese-related sulfurtransferase [Mariniflexile fucanivorans]|uniref:Rhodanese-related sulfurtransferase n=1 Tax=Mariniflexile fucanivorans TaxID=264023 RepID=A0A4R1RQK8_9FLAO|nr:rhodanese-like domain-containing protein [Mariniflexile fucanivorans]TCL68688.1 rhodanese-related sulfurtransferase [Mariniflexile fucanivorans]